MRQLFMWVAIALSIVCSWSAFAQDELINPPETQSTEAGEAELSEEQFAGFLMQLGVLSQRFERTSPEMRKALLVMNSLMLIGSTEEDVEGYLAETLDLLERTNLPNPIDSPLQPTGNGLLDAYLAEVERQVYAMNIYAEDWSAEVDSVGIPTPEFLAACEAEHSSEPDFWELKYVAALSASAGQPQPDYDPGILDPPGADAMAQWEKALSVFATAEQAGCADAELLCNWYKTLAEFHRTKAQIERGEEKASAYDFYTGGMYDAELAILDRAIALDPDNAWPYYQRALINLLRGSSEQGLGDLKAGNLAPKYEPPLLFPLREVRASFTADYPAGSAAAGGAVLAHYWDLPGAAPLALDSIFTKAAINAAMRGPASAGDELPGELWGYIVRTGQLPGLDRVDYLTACVRIRQLLQGAVGEEKLQDVHPELDLLSLGITSTCTDALYSTPDYFSSIITMAVAGGMPGYYAGFYAVTEADCNPAPDVVAQVFNDLAGFDIRTMAAPPSWEKYRTKGEERWERREESRRKREQREQEAAEQAGAH